MTVTTESFYTINSFLALACGISSTMPIVTVPRTSISLFTVLTAVFLMINLFVLVRSFKFKMGYHTFKLVTWLAAGFSSCLFGILYYSTNDEWRLTVQGFGIKVVVFLIICFIVCRSSYLLEPLLKGLLYGSIANVVVSIIDATIYYSLGYSIINSFFQSYIETNHVRYGLISLTFPGIIRSGGFNHDPAHIGMLAPMVFMYGLVGRKFIYVLLAIGGVLSSLSTTAFVCCVICYIQYYFIIKKSKISLRLNGKKILVYIGWGVMLFFLINRYGDSIFIGAENLFNRIDKSHVQTGMENIRLLYIMHAPQAMFEQGFFKMITGTGFSTASEGFLKLGNEFGLVLPNFPYDMENTYLAYIFDLGFYGFYLYVFYLYITAKSILKALLFNPDNQIIQIAFAGIFAIIFSSLFYHYTLFACQVLIFIAVSILLDKEINKN